MMMELHCRVDIILPCGAGGHGHISFLLRLRVLSSIRLPSGKCRFVIPWMGTDCTRKSTWNKYLYFR